MYVLNAIFLFLRTYLLQVLNFILNIVDRKPAVSIFQDVLKLLFTNFLVIFNFTSFVKLDQLNYVLSELDVSSWIVCLNFCCM